MGIKEKDWQKVKALHNFEIVVWYILIVISTFALGMWLIISALNSPADIPLQVGIAVAIFGFVIISLGWAFGNWMWNKFKL